MSFPRRRRGQLSRSDPMSHVMIEALERRELLSDPAAPTAILRDGVLTIRGTHGDDSIWIHQDALSAPLRKYPIRVSFDIADDATDKRFRAADVREIRAY